METKLIRVPFDVDMAKKITNGEIEGKVVTRNGEKARILSFDRKDEYRPIIALIKNGDMENVYALGINGKEFSGDTIGKNDLMLEIPEHTAFKDGDLLVCQGDYEWVFVYRECEYRTGCYAAICTKEFDLYIDGEGHVLENDKIRSIRRATEKERYLIIGALKSREDTRAKDYLKRFFGIEEKPECEFKPFDKVLVSDEGSEWSVDMFSHVKKDGMFVCVGGIWMRCIPYNEQTAHLLGTCDEYDTK